MTLQVGDAVLVRREPTVSREGPTRFQERVYDGVFRVSKKISDTTYHVEDLVDKDRVLQFKQPLHAERLVKVDMPELDLAPGQPRGVEVRSTVDGPWRRGRIERFGVDGRVCVKFDAGDSQWLDLSECEYRYVN